MNGTLCPKCGAYWRCGCSLEALAFEPLRRCQHDWVDAVGIAMDDDLLPDGAGVLVCRLCGLYAVREQVGGVSR
jgi:hypothetical protein